MHSTAKASTSTRASSVALVGMARSFEYGAAMLSLGRPAVISPMGDSMRSCGMSTCSLRWVGFADSSRLARVVRLLELPAPLLSLKVQVGSRQCDDETDERSTPTFTAAATLASSWMSSITAGVRSPIVSIRGGQVDLAW
jgi:hypothetical protein